MSDTSSPVSKTDAQWRLELTDEQFRITRCAGTERPHSGPHLDENRDGVYRCICCKSALFSSAAKFDSGSGWPSFYAAIGEAVAFREDRKLIMPRTEIACANCDAHLGHVFDDGPPPTGKRFCVNGHALDFAPDGRDDPDSNYRP